MKRRTFLIGTGTSAVALASSYPAPAIAQGIRELKLVTSWPKDFPGFDTSAARLAQAITGASGGKLVVKVFAADELVGAFEVFDAVAGGVADMYHSAEYYWHDRSPAFSFFAAVPFGLTAEEMNAWIYHGGGQDLWDELSAEFNIKPLLCANIGVNMGGWFTKELTSVDSYRDLRMRIPGLGAEVVRRLGGIAVSLPGGQIVAALQSGAIDAAEWVGPWSDLSLGLHDATKFYYYPGFHEPGTSLSLGINKTLWDSLHDDDRQVIQTAATAENCYAKAEFDAENAKALETLVKSHGVQLRKFDDAILQTIGKISEQMLAEIGDGDALIRRVYQSFLKFRESAMKKGEVTQSAYLHARRLAVPVGE